MHHTAHCCLPLLLLLAVPFAGATPVFTWVDDAGVTHFSETPPTDETADARRIEVKAVPPAGADAPENDFYSVVNQAGRMENRRLESEKLAAEKQQANAEARKARAEASAIQQGAYNGSYPDSQTRYYPVYSYYPPYGRYPWKPGHGYRPKPVHPVYPGHARPMNPRTSLGKTPGMPR